MSMYEARRAFIRCVAGLFVLGLALSGACSKSTDEPSTADIADESPSGAIRHVIFISIDTLRADHLACYGHPFVKSPHIDRLAAEGVRFTHHFSAASTTLSSHTTMMTGTYPHTHGVIRNGFVVHADNLMMAEILGQAGFKTAGFVGAHPLFPVTNFSQGFDHFDAPISPETGGGQRRAHKVTDAVLDWLGRWEADRTDPNERLFLFAHYFDVHWPYLPPPPYGGMYRGDAAMADGSYAAIKTCRQTLRAGYPWHASRDTKVQHRYAHLRAAWEDGVTRARGLDQEYSAEVTFCDFHIGRLIDGLRDRGLLDKSLVIVTSDHGETMTEHTPFFEHGPTVFDTEIHVPLIMRFPQGEFGGRVVSRLGSHVDLLPTVLDVLELDTPDGIEGLSFKGAITGTMPPRKPIFAEATKPWRDPGRVSAVPWPNQLNVQCVQTVQYKYMFAMSNNYRALFDPRQDRSEQRNLLDQAEAYDQTVAEDMINTLNAWRDGAHPHPSRKVVKEDHLKALKSLGYVGDDDD